MPDGTFIDATQEDIPVLTLDEKQIAGKINIWLGIAARKDFAWEGDSVRYRSVSDGKGADAIDRLRPVITLHTEAPPPKFVAMPLLRLERSPSSSELVSNYEPPWLSVPAGSALIEVLSKVSALLRRKVDLLVSQIRNPEQALAGVGELRGRVRSVAGGLPVLEALLNAGAASQQYGHPFALYQTLCVIAGHVAILGHDLAPPEFPPYDHQDQLASFNRVAQFIELAVNQGISEQWVGHRFESIDGGFELTPTGALSHYVPDPDQWPSVVIGLSIGREQTRHTVLEWGHRCLIASGDVSVKRLNRVTGAARHEWANPSDLTAPNGFVLFAISKGDTTLNFSEKLQLLGDAPRPAEAILYVRQAQGETI